MFAVNKLKILICVYIASTIGQISASTEDSFDIDREIARLNENAKQLIRLPFNCKEALSIYKSSGVYNIQAGSKAFPVFCLADPNYGDPWTLIQRRVDGTINFYREWLEYEQGFGEMYTNFFIGLSKLHALTTQSEPQELWIQLQDNVTVNAYYDRFAIGNAAQQYALNVLGAYKGDAGDALRKERGMKFTTKDVDNDESANNCAKMFDGAWWYKNCASSNLNGIYGTIIRGHGVTWLPFRNDFVSLKYAHMAIRPIQRG